MGGKLLCHTFFFYDVHDEMIGSIPGDFHVSTFWYRVGLVDYI